MSKHLYFYSDASEWGGQEILAARIANILVQKYQVHFFFSTKKFDSELLPAVERIPLPFCSQGPFPIVRDRISKKKGIAKKIFQEHGAGTGNFKQLIVCPGNIERCTPGILAATELKLEIVSYYAMAFTQKECQATLGALRDKLAMSVYPKISKWIVNTPHQERLLRRFIPNNVPVFQLPNPLTYTQDLPTKQPTNIKQVATIGRLFFGQKGQDIIPKIAGLLKGSGIQFQVIGQGPDTGNFLDAVNKNNLSGIVHHCEQISHEEIKAKFQNEIDLLLITSKFESGPMVLFEALQCGVPVLVANEEYSQDYNLPPWMFYEPGNYEDAAQKIKKMPQRFDGETFEKTRQALFDGRRDEDFQQRVLCIFSQV